MAYFNIEEGTTRWCTLDVTESKECGVKAIRINEPRQLQLVDLPEPQIVESDQVKVHIKAAGICGSDVSIYHGKSPVAIYPRVLGHEMTGEVVEIGSDVTNTKVGDRVIVKQTESCGECYACTHGRENVCIDLKVRGVTIDGGWAEYVVAPSHSVYPFSETIDFKSAVLIEPFTIAFHGCARGRLQVDDTLLVYGAGALGSALVTVAASFGCKIIAIDIDDEKLLQARVLGADIVLNGNNPRLGELIREAANNYGPTVAIDSVCTPRSVEFLLDVLGNAGRLVTMGFDTRVSEIAQYKITAREIDIIGSRLQYNNFPQVIDLFERGVIKTEGLISHVFHYTEYEKAFALVETGAYKKIIFDFS